MPIRKGLLHRLHRPCTSCGKKFQPKSRFSRLCDKCYFNCIRGHTKAKKRRIINEIKS